MMIQDHFKSLLASSWGGVGSTVRNRSTVDNDWRIVNSDSIIGRAALGDGWSDAVDSDTASELASQENK